jgi:hypothetical protein
MIKVDENTPLLKFLLWSSPDATQVDLETARTLYFKHQDYAQMVQPSEFELQLILELVGNDKRNIPQNELLAVLKCINTELLNRADCYLSGNALVALVFDASVQVEYIEFSASIVSLTHLKQSVHQNGIGEFFSCHDLNISISCVEQHAIKCLVRLNGKEPVMIKIMQESIEPLMPTQYIVTPLSLTTMAVGKPIMIAQALINIADSNWKMADDALSIMMSHATQDEIEQGFKIAIAQRPTIATHGFHIKTD